MKVIKTTKKKGHLTEVVFDDMTYILLDDDIFLKGDFSLGATVSDEEADKAETESDFLRAKNRALYYLSIKGYTEKELKDKLTKAGFGAEPTAKTIARLKELYLIDDMAYALQFVKKANENLISKREIKHKLIEKGIDRENAEYLTDDNCTPDQEKLKAIILKRFSEKLGDEKENEKAFSYFVRKGFSFSDIKKAINEYIDEAKEC